MNTNISKILAVTTIMIFIGAGVCFADGWKNDGGSRGHAYGHNKPIETHHYYPHYAPRPVYVERCYRPVIVERHYYHEPVRYIAPAPNGSFFGMSVAEPGVAFSFAISGH